MSNQNTTTTKKPASDLNLPSLETLYGGKPEDALNFMGIDAGLKKELTEQGLPWKFINYVTFKKNGSVSKGGWVPYKRKTKADNAFGALFATDPDGYTVRAEMVLAVRDPNLHAYFKEQLRRRNQSYDLKNIQKNQANQFRRQGLNVDEGYGRESDED
jgi:hypothetical protein